jgi:quercetin dioxygenase-like cupin family protein
MEQTKRTFADLEVVESASIKPITPEPGLTRLVGTHNDKLFLAEHRMAKGYVGSRHSHPHEQVVYVISGHLKVSCEDRSFDLRSGDSFVVRGGIEHQATAPEESVVIDVFTPCRSDYL